MAFFNLKQLILAHFSHFSPKNLCPVLFSKVGKNPQKVGRNPFFLQIVLTFPKNF
jgi:hypothetical protein